MLKAQNHHAKDIDLAGGVAEQGRVEADLAQGKVQQVVDYKGQQGQAGIDHGLGGQGGALDSFFGVANGFCGSVLQGQPDAEGHMDQEGTQQAEAKDPQHRAEFVQLLCVGIDRCRSGEQGRIAEQVSYDKTR